jgi:hypothetical protein
MTPTDRAPCRSRSSPIVLRRFLAILSVTLPSPVSRTASSASARLRAGSTMAQAAATGSFVGLCLGPAIGDRLRGAGARDDVTDDSACISLVRQQ